LQDGQFSAPPTQAIRFPWSAIHHANLRPPSIGSDFSEGIPSNLVEESPEGGTETDPKYLVPHSGVYI